MEDMFKNMAGVYAPSQEEIEAIENNVAMQLESYLNPAWFIPGKFEIFVSEINAKLEMHRGSTIYWTFKIKKDKSCGFEVDCEGNLSSFVYKSLKGKMVYPLYKADVSRAIKWMIKKMVESQDDGDNADGTNPSEGKK